MSAPHLVITVFAQCCSAWEGCRTPISEITSREVNFARSSHTNSYKCYVFHWRYHLVSGPGSGCHLRAIIYFIPFFRFVRVMACAGLCVHGDCRLRHWCIFFIPTPFLVSKYRYFSGVFSLTLPGILLALGKRGGVTRLSSYEENRMFWLSSNLWTKLGETIFSAGPTYSSLIGENIPHLFLLIDWYEGRPTWK